MVTSIEISVDIVSTQLKDFNYYYVTLLILFNINHLFVDSDAVSSIAMYR